jgi:hypothetical protein
MYHAGYLRRNSMLAVHMFGIIYEAELTRSGISVQTVLDKSGLGKSLGPQITAGRRLAGYVKVVKPFP